MMCRYSLCLSFLAALVAGAVSGQPLPILDASRITEHKLPNGLRVVIKEERQWPVVALGAYVRAGSIHEQKGEEGAAHFLEHMLFETTGAGGAKLAPQVESMGGRIEAVTMRDFAHVNVTLASQYLENLLPLLVKAVFETQLDAREVKRELAVVRQEMSDRATRVDNVLSDMLWGLAFKEHPYGRPIGGVPETLAHLTTEAVRTFQQRYYVPNNAAVVVVGDVDPTWVVKQLGQLTAKYPTRAVAWPEPVVEAPPARPRLRVEKMAREVSLVGYAWHAPGIADKPGVCAADLVYTILGQGPMGRLQRRLVDEAKVALSVQTQFLTQKHPGLMIITALVHRGREQEAQALILDEIRKLDEEPVTTEELDLAKRLLYTDYAFTNESYSDQIGSLGFYESIDSFRFAVDYITEVMRITPAQIQGLARKHLRRDGYALVVLEGQKGERTGGGDTQL